MTLPTKEVAVKPAVTFEALAAKAPPRLLAGVRKAGKRKR